MCKGRGKHRSGREESDLPETAVTRAVDASRIRCPACSRSNVPPTATWWYCSCSSCFTDLAAAATSPAGIIRCCVDTWVYGLCEISHLWCASNCCYNVTGSKNLNLNFRNWQKPWAYLFEGAPQAMISMTHWAEAIVESAIPAQRSIFQQIW